MSAPFLILGIDPGLTGAVAWLKTDPDECRVELLHVEDIPTAQAKQGKTMKSHLLLSALADILGNPVFNPSHVVIEEVGAMPGQGVTSMFRFGHTAGAIAGICAGLRFPVHFVRPNVWTRQAGVRPGDDAGRLRANQLFPNQAHLFARKKDHNRADAALIAYAFACGLLNRPNLPTR